MSRGLGSLVVLLCVAFLVGAGSGGAVAPLAPHITASITVDAGPMGLAVAGGGLWVAKHESNDVVKINPATNQIVADVHVSTGSPGRFTVGGGSLWLANYSSTAVNRIDPVTNNVVATIHTPSEIGGFPAFAGGYAWIECGGELQDHFAKIDPASNAVGTTGSLGQGAFGATAGGGSLWVTTNPPRTCKTVIKKVRRKVRGKWRTVKKKVRRCTKPPDVFKVGHITRVDPQTMQSTRLPIVGVPLGFAAGSVWAVHASNLLRIDPATSAVVATIQMPEAIGYVAGDLSECGRRATLEGPGRSTGSIRRLTRWRGACRRPAARSAARSQTSRRRATVASGSRSSTRVASSASSPRRR
jgi:hypothetical protein